MQFYRNNLSIGKGTKQGLQHRIDLKQQYSRVRVRFTVERHKNLNVNKPANRHNSYLGFHRSDNEDIDVNKAFSRLCLCLYCCLLLLFHHDLRIIE